MHHIGEYYEIAETAEKVYIGSDFPDYGNRHGNKAKNGCVSNQIEKPNGLERVDNEVIPSFETDGESMDVYIACK